MIIKMFQNLFLFFKSKSDWGKYVEDISVDDFFKYHYPWL